MGHRTLGGNSSGFWEEEVTSAGLSHPFAVVSRKSSVGSGKYVIVIEWFGWFFVLNVKSKNDYFAELSLHFS